ncbi:MAG: Hsp20/alpha crystallin family protein [Candidatus Dadabacteria bacterium]|nr:Hsp20/alpha crystallin family protein [Candidatus Dadabacteria bacterium]
MKYAVNLWEPTKVFRNFASAFPGVFDSDAAEASRSPKVDIFDDGNSFILSAELPGVSREDLDIDIKDNRLTVKAEKKLENSTKKDGYLRVERSYGVFERTFFLDENVDRESIKADYKNGVLRLTLPRKQDETSKKIEVN